MVTDTNWAKTTCDKMVGTIKNGQTVANVGLEHVHEAALHGGSGGRGDTAEAVVLRQVPHWHNAVCRVIRGEMEGQLLVFWDWTPALAARTLPFLVTGLCRWTGSGEIQASAPRGSARCCCYWPVSGNFLLLIIGWVVLCSSAETCAPPGSFNSEETGCASRWQNSKVTVLSVLFF